MKGVSNETYILMGRCIANEASAHERLALENFLHENEDLKTIFIELKHYYQSKEKSEIKDPEPAFERLNNKLKQMNNL